MCDRMTFHEPKPGSKPTSIVGSPDKIIWAERLIQRHRQPLGRTWKNSEQHRRATMDTATTTTFQVLEVQPATTPLPEVPYKQAVEALLTID